MSFSLLVTILATIAVLTAGAIIFVLASHKGSKNKKPAKTGQDAYTEQAEKDVEHIFNDEFREELRNRGRLHFEKIIGDNAMFLQQDLRLTTSELNEFMKSEITRRLKEEFAKYEESIMDAKQLALDSISKTQEAIEEQRQAMGKQLAEEIQKEKQRVVARFESNMADIVNHYVLSAVGDQIDLNDQLEFILSDLEANKQAIIQDITDGT